jgi:integrase/recombinase XerD
MLALAYDAALRREELCLLATDDLDPAHRTLRVRAEKTKTHRGRVVPYSAVAGQLMAAYLRHRRSITRERGVLFVSESPRNRAAAISPWTWSKVVRSIAVRAGVETFSTHTLPHLCRTDLARSGWELHAIATFAGHQKTETTQRYIHLSATISPTGLRPGSPRSMLSGSRSSGRRCHDRAGDLFIRRLREARQARGRRAARG